MLTSCTRLAASLKALGISVGIAFPEEPQAVTLMGPIEVKDLLALTLPLPEFDDFFDSLAIDRVARTVLEQRLGARDVLIQSYRS